MADSLSRLRFDLTALTNRVTNEITNRATVVTAITARLSTEVQNRATAINALDTRLKDAEARVARLEAMILLPEPEPTPTAPNESGGMLIWG